MIENRITLLFYILALVYVAGGFLSPSLLVMTIKIVHLFLYLQYLPNGNDNLLMLHTSIFYLVLHHQGVFFGYVRDCLFYNGLSAHVKYITVIADYVFNPIAC